MRARIEISKRQLRSFGLIVGGGFLIVSLWPTVFRGETPRGWALVVALTLPAAALTVPSVLQWPYRIWMFVGEVLGWINTRIILGLVYYGLIVPIGLAFRIIGTDPMHRGFEPDQETYRIPRDKRPASHLHRQY